MWHRPLSLAVAVAVLAACGGGSGGNVVTVREARAACNGGVDHVEVRDSGIVDRILGIRRGPAGTHEGFIVAFPARDPSEQGMIGFELRARIEDNVDITGRIPLRPGDRITLQGQLECNDGVIHWTHHDPSGRHTAGFVEANGRRYQ